MYRRSREDLPALMAKMWAIFGFYLVYHHQLKKGLDFCILIGRKKKNLFIALKISFYRNMFLKKSDHDFLINLNQKSIKKSFQRLKLQISTLNLQQISENREGPRSKFIYLSKRSDKNTIPIEFSRYTVY